MSALSKMRNEANWERILRTLVGAILLSLTFIGPQTWWGLLGIIPLVTGSTGVCPLYTILGVSTCPSKNADKKAA
jgi:hypothetical protein